MVDDSATSRTLLKQVLESDGFEVDLAPSPTLGLELTNQKKYNQSLSQILGENDIKKMIRSSVEHCEAETFLFLQAIKPTCLNVQFLNELTCYLLLSKAPKDKKRSMTIIFMKNYGEKIDVIEWNPDISTYIAAALLPASIMAVDIKEDEKVIKILR